MLWTKIDHNPGFRKTFGLFLRLFILLIMLVKHLTLPIIKWYVGHMRVFIIVLRSTHDSFAQKVI